MSAAVEKVAGRDAAKADFRDLSSGFLSSAAAFPDRAALEVEGHVLSYDELRRRASAIASTLMRHAPEGPPLTGVFAYRSTAAYVGVLGSLLRGHAYVPLNRQFPVARTRAMLERAGCRALVVDEASSVQLDELLAGIAEPLLLLFPDAEDVGEIARRFPEHSVLGARDIVEDSTWRPIEALPDATAYLLFTSGSTGTPKGVGVAHRNVRPFIDFMTERYDVGEDDRFTQTFDMTFDLSVFDMFVAWERGACVCAIPHERLISPGKFVRESEPTIWFSVPSLALHMKRFGMLKENRYPSLRWSLFCGEGLPTEVATAWAKAAPSSVVENLYGPTEATIACMFYRWDPRVSPGESEFGLVPIGEPYPETSVIVVDGDLREVAPGDPGELLLCGSQVTPGYWHDPDKTAAAFVRPPGRDAIHYRTGDLVRRPQGSGPVTYLGRVDHQIKINGYRVELGEVEETLRRASGFDEAVAIGWPRTASGASAITAFVGAPSVDEAAVRREMAKRLPDYMVPRAIVPLEAIPLNANGKYDRNALAEMLEQR